MKEEGEVHRNKKERAPASPEDCPSGRDERPEIKEEKMAIDGAIFFRRWLQRETFFFFCWGVPCTIRADPSERKIHQAGSRVDAKQPTGWGMAAAKNSSECHQQPTILPRRRLWPDPNTSKSFPSAQVWPDCN